MNRVVLLELDERIHLKCKKSNYNVVSFETYFKEFYILLTHGEISKYLYKSQQVLALFLTLINLCRVIVICPLDNDNDFILIN